jgi:hypothetical protein
MDSLFEDLYEYSKTAFAKAYVSESPNFDQWLFMDAGTSFGYAFESHILHKVPTFVSVGKRLGYDLGKLFIYRIQLFVRKNPDFTIEMIYEQAKSHISDLITEMKSMNILPVVHSDDYSYFS